ncbi:MAG: hypothetical protein WD045_15840 [Pirellulaceae bacterium]
MSTIRRTSDRRKLPPHIIEEVIRLRAAGQTQMEIKRKTGISRTSIHYILRGRPTADEASQARQAEETLGLFDGPIERCPGCGRRVHMPCMPCRIESAVETERFSNPDRRQRGV